MGIRRAVWPVLTVPKFAILPIMSPMLAGGTVRFPRGLEEWTALLQLSRMFGLPQ